MKTYLRILLQFASATHSFILSVTLFPKSVAFNLQSIFAYFVAFALSQLCTLSYALTSRFLTFLHSLFQSFTTSTNFLPILVSNVHTLVCKSQPLTCWVLIPL